MAQSYKTREVRVKTELFKKLGVEVVNCTAFESQDGFVRTQGAIKKLESVSEEEIRDKIGTGIKMSTNLVGKEGVILSVDRATSKTKMKLPYETFEVCDYNAPKHKFEYVEVYPSL